MNRNWKDAILILWLIFAMASSIALAQDTAVTQDTAEAMTYACPTAVDDQVVSVNGAPVTIYVLTNDEFTVNAYECGYSQGSLGTVRRLCTGTYIYTPPKDFCGKVDTFTYKLCQQSGCDPSTGTVTVTGVCTCPVAKDDSATASPGTVISIDVLSNDKDIDDATTICSVESPTDNGGTAVLKGNKITYTAPVDSCGETDTFTYSLCKTGCTPSTATVTVKSDCVCPVANDDSATTYPGTAVAIDVLSNDQNKDGATICHVESPTDNGGTAVISGNKILYTPNAGFCGPDTFTYSLCKTGCSQSTTATVAVTVVCCPKPMDDTATTLQGTAVTIDVLSNDENKDGATICNVQSGSDGTAVVNGNKVVYTPKAGFCGPDTFTYSLCKTGCGQSGTATVAVSVICCPVAIDDLAPLSPNTPDMTIDVLSNDQNKDGATICSVQSPTPKGGTAVLEGNEIIYTPPADFCGKTDTFTYTLCEGSCSQSTATVTVESECQISCPVAIDDPATTYQGKAVTIDVLSNDENIDGATTICKVQSPTTIGGTAVISGNQILYTPKAGYCGEDKFTYTLCRDGCVNLAPATVTVSVICCPMPMGDIANTFQGTAVSIDVLNNDLNKDGATICNVQSPTTNGGTAVLENGKITYTPKAGYCGADDFTYSLCKDGCGQSVTAKVAVTVVCCPLPMNDIGNTFQGSPVTIDVLNNDLNKDGATICNVQAATTNGGTAVLKDGKITYTPKAGYCGADDFTYSLCNDGCGQSVTAKVAVSVICCPKPMDDTATTYQGTAVSIDVLNNDLNKDGATICNVQAATTNGGTAVLENGKITYTPKAGYCGADDFTYSLCKDGCGQSVTAKVAVTVACCPLPMNDIGNTFQGSPVTIDVLSNDQNKDGATICNVQSPTTNGGTAVLKDGKITYTPKAGYCGADDFTYSLCNDGCGQSVTAKVAVSVICCPKPMDDTATTYQGTAVSIDVLNNDLNKDGATICNVQAATTNGGTAVLENGKITYTPKAGYCGADDFTYSLCKDGCGQSVTAKVAVTVACCPLPMNDIGNTFQGSPVTIDVLSNDLNKDGATICNVQAATTNGGTAVLKDGKITYTPKAGYCGADDFTYSLCKDGCGQSVTAKVAVTVVCCPLPMNDIGNTFQGSPVTIDVLSNDLNKDGATICNVQAATTNGGTAVLKDGKITYTPKAGYCGADDFTYSLCKDGCGQSVTAKVAVTVVCCPKPMDDTATTSKGTAVTIDVLSNDQNKDGATICEVQSTTAKGGKAVISNGKITYTPASCYCGTDTFTYSICKTGCDKSTATVTVTVTCPVCPTAVNDQATTAKGAAITIDALVNDKDTTGASICAVQSTTAKGGKAAISNGKITYTPCSTFCGTDTFTYSICKTGCDKSTATVTVTVTCPVCPVAVNDQATTAKGAAITIDALANDKDTTGASICAVQSTTAKGGKAVISNGKITYTPASCYCGTDTFTYSICKTGCDKSTATVTVTVTCPVCPTAVNDQATTAKGVAITIDALANDKDTTGAAICYVQSTTAKGQKAVISNGKITYTPCSYFYGTDTFTYSICKTGCDKSTATVTVIVNRGGY